MINLNLHGKTCDNVSAAALPYLDTYLRGNLEMT